MAISDSLCWSPFCPTWGAFFLSSARRNVLSGRFSKQHFTTFLAVPIPHRVHNLRAQKRRHVRLYHAHHENTVDFDPILYKKTLLKVTRKRLFTFTKSESCFLCGTESNCVSANSRRRTMNLRQAFSQFNCADFTKRVLLTWSVVADRTRSTATRQVTTKWARWGASTTSREKWRFSPWKYLSPKRIVPKRVFVQFAPHFLLTVCRWTFPKTRICMSHIVTRGKLPLSCHSAKEMCSLDVFTPYLFHAKGRSRHRCRKRCKCPFAGIYSWQITASLHWRSKAIWW